MYDNNRIKSFLPTGRISLIYSAETRQLDGAGVKTHQCRFSDMVSNLISLPAHGKGLRLLEYAAEDDRLTLSWKKGLESKALLNYKDPRQPAKQATRSTLHGLE